jgi:hypothetical protein
MAYNTGKMNKRKIRCETWSVTRSEEHRVKVFENRVLSELFGPKREEVTGEWKDFIMRSFMIYTHHQILLRCSNQ